MNAASTQPTRPRLSLLLHRLPFAFALWLCVPGGAWAQSVSATYTHGSLSLAVPYPAHREASGTLSVEVLDPEGHTLGSSDHAVAMAKVGGFWTEDIPLSNAVKLDDLVWDRVRYRFDSAAVNATEANSTNFAETKSISEILRRPLVHIVGQSSYIAGAPAAIRVIVTDKANQPIAGSSSVRIELESPGHAARLLFNGRLDRRGTVNAQFRFPAGVAGSYQLHYIAETSIGSADFTEPVRLRNEAQILLTTEKPIYQPGQTIHTRALALDRANHHSAANRKLTFEVEDSRGNKVFRKATRTDAFGIASAEFTLADEVNLGTYHLRALMGDAASPANTAEVALTVQRYVLPKFNVAIDFAEVDGKPRKYYRPGDRVTGAVHANYFFGKPVDNATIEIKATSMDVSLFQAGDVHGATDKNGVYRFDFTLPSYFAGSALDHGTAQVLVEATVKDSAGHAETRGEPITVSQSSLLITAVPEGGQLIPGLENEVFVLTSYPDGTPAETKLTVAIAGAPTQHVATDENGVAVVRVKPGEIGESLHIEAGDRRSDHASRVIDLPANRNGDDQILLRTNHAVYKIGDAIDLGLFCTKPSGAAYVDIIRNGQTLLTRDVDIQDGRADLSIVAAPAMSGTLDIDAYIFGRNAAPIHDHRLVFVAPADELKIVTTADAAAYLPGADARIHFRITNARGQGVSAALGLQVVDEAVFALAEKQPGFAKVFFYLEQQLMKPRYEIHSLSLPNIIEPAADMQQRDERDRGARALFAATGLVNDNQFETTFGRSLPQDKQAEYTGRYHAAFMDQVQRLAGQFSNAYRQHPAHHDLTQLIAAMQKENGVSLRDPWGTELRLEPVSWIRGNGRYYRLRSAGPDQQFNTADDLSAYIEVHPGSVVAKPGPSSIHLKVEHDRGPFNGRAEISGTVADATGVAVPAAHITLRRIGSADLRKTTSNAAGEFTLTAVPAGTYSVEIFASGFDIISRTFAIGPRDLARITSTLSVGPATETVTLATDAIEMLPMNGRVFMEDAMALGAVGVPGAIMGGMAAGSGMGAGIGSGSGFERRVPAKLPASFLQPGSATSTPTHIRSYFPEALYVNPEIITNANGDATISIPMADSITTWRMAMLASTQDGALGTSSSSLKVFQDFFVDLDLPVTLTQGDRVSIPVAIYNYSRARGDVKLSLQPGNWFSLIDDSSEKSVSVAAGQVGSSQFTLRADRIGKFKLTLSATSNAGGGRTDTVVREIEVVPNGRENNIIFNGRLDTSVQHNIAFPTASIPGAEKILVRLYPGPLSQVIEGMDSILRMPSGCFEQTSSSTYPNVLALDYMKRTGKLTPEVHAKAEGYIANGYQRLLTFEVPGGGFSWFGSVPANKILTAYGLMEFSDMSKVYDVDPNLISRTREWLIAQQQEDGSWKPDTSFINEGATNRYNSDELRITAYIAWALETTGGHSQAVDKAKQYIEANLNSDTGSKADIYTLAVLANFAVDYDQDHAFTQRVMQRLLDASTEKDNMVSWNAEETGVYSTGSSAAVETTGLAVQALLKWGQASDTVRKALSFITSKKDASGNWGTTQATIMALRALLLASERGTSDVHGSVAITLNGNVVDNLVLTSDNNDLFQQFVLPNVELSEANNIQLHFAGTGSLAYQIVGRYFVPWSHQPTDEPLSISVTYDRTTLSQNDIATATAIVKNRSAATANMVMVDLGIPPGFDLLSEDLQAFEEAGAGAKSGHLEKFSLTATQAILYFDSLAPHSTTTLHFRLRAKFPIHAHSFQSRVYEYYNPDVSATAPPAELEVRAR